MKVLLTGKLIGQGGIQTHLKWLARMLGDAGIETQVLVLDKWAASAAEWGELEHWQTDNIRFVYCPTDDKPAATSRWTTVQRLLEVTAIIRNFAPDVYFVAGGGWNQFLPPLLAALKGRKVFHEVMSGMPRNWRDSRWLARWCFSDIVGQSAIVADNFAEHYGWKQPIPALPAIPEPIEVSAKLPMVSPRAVPLGTAKAAFFSRLVPHKKGFWLVQQWDQLKEVLAELHIHGTGPEADLIRTYIDEHQLGDRVKWMGRYPDGQAYADLLSQYDLTLLPTVGAEGAPLVLLESMACGVPFVAYGVGGIPDYGVNNPNAIVVAPEPWITDQARVYAEVRTEDQASQTTTAFVTAVKQMTYKLAEGQIDQRELQQFYLRNYSYAVLKKAWISYLCNDNRHA